MRPKVRLSPSWARRDGRLAFLTPKTWSGLLTQLRLLSVSATAKSRFLGAASRLGPCRGLSARPPALAQFALEGEVDADHQRGEGDDHHGIAGGSLVEQCC